MSSLVQRSYDIRGHHPWYPEARKARVAVDWAIGGALTMGREKVPQETYKGQDTSFISCNAPAVYPSTEGALGLGIPLTGCLTPASMSPCDMQAQALQDLPTKTTKISMCINILSAYKGYQTGQYTVKNTKGIISKAKLAEIVALEVQTIIRDGAVADPLWKLGDDGIQIEDIYLTEVRHVSKARLQPHFEIVRRA
ncbi:predicted protein [Postia placenta Mad-698-R]|uniref:Uncharacterized protein n=1 Tax=Postia placenta MAD-698-R-SB12 TaxID=670580 RepID=A0A1X6NBC0_9APHY|nr:hypothetical protein POSPLADRAFT_1038409 [Postia placenta MAD-698-R-SB12]EED79910.1 predicted protein [Postia placenta Mad-698-R]OSX65820.1 hypothetical protein POSPLADRAFT_1038409 [Postia placenta MAD-698-R-SB12]